MLKFDSETTHGLLTEFCLQITNLCRYFIAETRVVSQIHRNLLANKFENKRYIQLAALVMKNMDKSCMKWKEFNSILE